MRRLLLLLLFVPCVLKAQNYNSQRISRLFNKPVERTYYVKERYHNGKLYVEGQAVQKIYSLKKRIELKRGPWKWYYRNGKVKDSVFFSDMGLPIGVELRYHSNGSIDEKVDYDTSTNFTIKERNWLIAIPRDYTKITYYKEPNIPRRIEVFVNKKKSGTWEYFDRNGTLIKKRNYVKGKLVSLQKN